jgi:hypothetical protein
MLIAVSPWDCRSPYSSYTIALREIIAAEMKKTLSGSGACFPEDLSTQSTSHQECPIREVNNA